MTEERDPIRKLSNKTCASCQSIYSYPIISIEADTVFAQCPLCGHKTEVKNMIEKREQDYGY